MTGVANQWAKHMRSINLAIAIWQPCLGLATNLFHYVGSDTGAGVGAGSIAGASMRGLVQGFDVRPRNVNHLVKKSIF